jgi:hypothetical protein
MMLDYYFETLASAEIPALREAMKAMIDRVTLSPTTLSAQVHYALATGDNMASRRGGKLSPVLITGKPINLDSTNLRAQAHA